jgi:RNA polymerase sigma-70 factor (ECF subfamily)
LTGAVTSPERGLEDSELARRARAGEAPAFEELVRRYSAAAIGAALRVTRDPFLAEDAAQEAFWKAYRALPGYREEQRFGAWIRRIALRCALDLMRRRRPEQPLDVAAEVSTSRSEEKWHEDRSRLEHALDRLKPRDRVLLLLLSADGLTTEEVAEELSLSAVAVRVRAHRARKKLRALLKEES